VSAANVVAFPTKFEPWVTKAQVAAYFGRSTRWVELTNDETGPSVADDRRTPGIPA
jgi:hypothetical protein